MQPQNHDLKNKFYSKEHFDLFQTMLLYKIQLIFPVWFLLAKVSKEYRIIILLIDQKPTNSLFLILLPTFAIVWIVEATVDIYLLVSEYI